MAQKNSLFDWAMCKKVESDQGEQGLEKKHVPKTRARGSSNTYCLIMLR